MRRLTITALVLAAAGIVVQIAGGVDYPTVPPGLIMLLVAAALLAVTTARWASYVTVAVSLFLTVGGAIAPTGRHNLAHPSNLGPFAGTLLQSVGVLVALAAGVALVARQRERASAPE